MPMSEPKHTCNWCAFCTEYDEGWFHRYVKRDMRNRRSANARNACKDYEASWCRADDYETIWGVDAKRAKEEREKYERRMAGDWS